MRHVPLVVLLAAGCAAVPPKLDPGTVGVVAPEEKFEVSTATDSAVIVDHLVIDADSLRAHRVHVAAADDNASYVVARSSVTDLRRSFHGGAGPELIMVPALAYMAMVGFFVLVFSGG